MVKCSSYFIPASKAVAADHVDWAVEREERTDTHDAHQLEQLAGLMLSLTTKMQQLEEVSCHNFRVSLIFGQFTWTFLFSRSVSRAERLIYSPQCP